MAESRSAENGSFSRRGFLKASIGAGLAVAGASVLRDAQPSYAGEGESRFTEEQLEKIGQPHPGSPVSYEPIKGTDPIPPAGVPGTWDVECDVVVVGCGGGGLVAATMCAEAGLSVWALDKNAVIGGATKESSIFDCPGGTRIQTEGQYAIPVFPYNPEAVVQMWLAQDCTINLDTARKYAVNIPKTADWMEDHGVPWEFSSAHGGASWAPLAWKGSVDGSFFPRAMEPTCNCICEAAKSAGAQFALQTQAVALVKEGDRVIGLKAVDELGRERYYRADKGVILTSGGMEASPEMLRKYCPTIYAGSASTYNPPCNTGEAIRMGLGAGASLIGFDKAEGFDGGIDAYADGLGPWSHYLYSGDNQLSRQPWLSIDRTGRRHVYLPFVPDGYRTGGLWDVIEGAPVTADIQGSLPGGRAYVIFDSDWESNVARFKQQGCRLPITPDMPNIDRMPEWLAPHDWRDGVADSIEKGIIKKADTIEELADLLNLEQEIVVSAVEHWNAICEAGEDAEYFYEPDWLVPIAKPPYFGIKIGRQVSKTHAGLEINANFQVVGTNGKPIEGLYAGTHTNGTPGVVARGNSGSWAGGYCCAEGLINSL